MFRRVLLFLDVDGVLNSAKEFKRQHELGIRQGTDVVDPVALLELKRLVEQTGCEIVLSSTWRLFSRTRSFLRQHFRKVGIPQWIDTTPNHNVSHGRAGEINHWLNENASGEDAIAVVLDDDHDADLPGTYFCRTSFENGLQPHHVDSIIEYVIKAKEEEAQ